MDTWETYPRPQLRRNSFFSLNGTWMLFPVEKEVTVPACLPDLPEDAELIYKKSFTLPEDFVKDRVLLHFGACDQQAEVFLNGKAAGSHKGGYTHFSFDVTDLLAAGENLLEVRVKDPLDTHVYPWGKQKRKPSGMWYTPVSGLWQTVWMESVPAEYIRNIRIEPALDHAEITLDLAGDTIRNAVLYMDGREIPFIGNHISLKVENPVNWTPENPHLYSFSIQYHEDRIDSYFALRTVGTGSANGIPRLLLNGKPYFFHGVLDQGYFMDGIYTPESPEFYIRDLQLLKDCGFNMLRKHIKIEPDLFYFYCDYMGIAVFQDMVNNGDYSFMKDTVLPTVGLKKLSDQKMNPDPETRAAFYDCMKETVTQLYNFPCIVYWTIFNEGWGQFDGSAAYAEMKKLDAGRVIDTASGWFSGVESDVQSDHVYFRKVRPAFTEKPYVLSEFGGYTYAEKDHQYDPGKRYGYRTFRNRKKYEDAVIRLFETQVLPYVSKGMCADVYTQFSDVETEINGLVTYDREAAKLDKERLKELGDRIRMAIEENDEKERV